MSVETPVPIKSYPHWRIVFRPGEFVRDRFAHPSECLDAVRRSEVRLRGWPFPRIADRQNQVEMGDTWVGSHSDFMGHVEYWRFYQSTQFIFLRRVREHVDQDWDTKIRGIGQWNIGDQAELSVDKTPGFFGFENFIYTMIEHFVFASRLCEAEVYQGQLDISIGLHGVRNFVLMTDNHDRNWPEVHRVTASDLEHTWRFETAELMASVPEATLEAILWFFQRFGWTNPAVKIIAEIRDQFLAGKI